MSYSNCETHSAVDGQQLSAVRQYLAELAIKHTCTCTFQMSCVHTCTSNGYSLRNAYFMVGCTQHDKVQLRTLPDSPVWSQTKGNYKSYIQPNGVYILQVHHLKTQQLSRCTTVGKLWLVIPLKASSMHLEVAVPRISLQIRCSHVLTLFLTWSCIQPQVHQHPKQEILAHGLVLKFQEITNQCFIALQ